MADSRIKLIIEGEDKGASRALNSASDALDGLGKKATSIGKGLTLGITAPLALIGKLAFDAGKELNAGMADVASLSIASDRVLELKNNIKDLQISSGKDAKDLTDGLYNVISAFGDTADAAKELDLAVKSGIAGRASTTEALSLISAATKGYGDASLAAQQHVSDLALKTVELGQTNLPQLAASIGQVTGMSANLGIKQEELFASASALTGVMGTASAVFTGQRGVMQALSSPTDTMTKLMKSLGYANGEAMVKGLGWGKTLQVIQVAQQRSGLSMQQFVGSIEGQNYIMYLAGSQLQKYNSDLEAMGNVTGKTDAAFKAQTTGVNAAGFAMEQAHQKFNVFLENLNDAAGPAFLSFMDLLEPLETKLLAMSEAFSKMDPTTQKWILGIAAGAAALGPLLIGVGQLLPMLGTMGVALGALVSPLGLVAAGIGALVYYNFDSIKEFSTTILGGIVASAPLAGAALSELIAQFTGIGLEADNGVLGIQNFVQALTGSSTAAVTVANTIGDIGLSLGEMQDRVTAAAPLLGTAFSELVAQLTGVGLEADNGVMGIQNFVEALTGSSTVAVTVANAVGDIGLALGSFQETITAIFSGPLARLQDSFLSIGASTGQLGPQFTALGTSIMGLFVAAQPALTGLAQLIGAAMGVSTIVSINLLSAAFQNLVPVIGAVVNQTAATITLFSTAISGMTTIVTSLLQGDFAGAWTGAQTVISGFSTYTQATLGNLSTVLSGIFNTIGTTITTTLSDLGFTKAAADVQIVIDKVTVLSTWLKSLVGGDIKITSPAWISTLTVWLPKEPAWLVTLTGWVAKTPEWLLSLISWVAKNPEWLTTLTGWVAKTPDWLAILVDWIAKTPDWLATLTGWIPATPAWVATLTSWVPATPAWLESLLSWRPSFPSLPFGLGGSPPPQHAAGTNYAPGGWSWVGEKGPELMRVPRGAQILSNRNSMSMIGQMADGNVALPTGLSGSQQSGLNSFVAAMQNGGDKAGKKIAAAMERATEKMQNALESAFQKVPGLFGTSQVTQKQMDMAKLGIPQNFADDWIRHLTDEVVNGVQWSDADIKDAATRAGIDPSLPAKAILEMVTEKWNDQSLFADPKNLDLINMDAVKQSLDLQKQQEAGKKNLMSLTGLFGGDPAALKQEALALGTDMRTSAQQGFAGTGGATTTGAGAASNINLAQVLLGSTAITPDMVAPMVGQLTTAITTAISGGGKGDKEKAGIDFGSIFVGAINSSLATSKAFDTTGPTILQKIVDSWASAKIDIVTTLANAMNTNIGTNDAIKALQNVGAKIFKIIFEGYDKAASGADYVAPVQSGINNSNKKTAASTTTLPSPSTATASSVTASSASYGRAGALAAAGAGGPTVNVYATVSSQIDLRDLAYQVASVLKRRQK